MASKDRILRLKEATRSSILDASLQIMKEEGWDALSMRKIADKIEYTAPVIYEYFANKDAILLELARKGFLLLAREVLRAKELHADPVSQLEKMWQAYWKFAFDEQELYRVMFGVGAKCCNLVEKLPEGELAASMIKTVIHQLIGSDTAKQDEIETTYYAFWSLTHGLVSLNMVRDQNPDKLNWQILEKAISSLLRSVKDKETHTL
jgi:AcrR family transcriptional regulator